MLLFGHTGITVGAIWLVEGLVLKKPFDNRRRNREPQRIGTVPSSQIDSSGKEESHKHRISMSGASLILYGMVLISSMLPDIIDKPVGMLFLRDTFSNGRIFSHTLVFSVILLVAGVFLYIRRKRIWLLAICYGCLMHLTLDQMWQTPATLFWPLYGWQFERADVTDWTIRIMYALTHDPSTYIPELAGFSILIAFAIKLVWRDKVISFLVKR